MMLAYTQEVTMTIHSVELFTHKDGNYITEASMLGWPPGQVPHEVGIQHRSGVVTRFSYHASQRDPEGDTQSWGYRSVGSPVGEKLTVFND